MAATISIHRPPVKPKPKLTYPVLARSYTHEQVVLFTDACAGILLHKGNTRGVVGEAFGGWLEVTLDTVWEILPEGTTVEIVQGGFE